MCEPCAVGHPLSMRLCLSVCCEGGCCSTPSSTTSGTEASTICSVSTVALAVVSPHPFVSPPRTRSSLPATAGAGCAGRLHRVPLSQMTPAGCQAKWRVTSDQGNACVCADAFVVFVASVIVVLLYVLSCLFLLLLLLCCCCVVVVVLLLLLCCCVVLWCVVCGVWCVVCVVCVVCCVCCVCVILLLLRCCCVVVLLLCFCCVVAVLLCLLIAIVMVVQQCVWMCTTHNVHAKPIAPRSLCLRADSLHSRTSRRGNVAYPLVQTIPRRTTFQWRSVLLEAFRQRLLCLGAS